MAKKRRPVQLVIDASVTAAAGNKDVEKAVAASSFRDPRPAICRQLLMMVLKRDFKIAVNPYLLREYGEHSSAFAVTWRQSCFARGRVAKNCPPQRDDALFEAVLATVEPEGKRRELEKDFHLIEAALASDLNIISLDKKARALYCRAAQEITVLRPVLWGDPTAHPKLARWLAGKIGRPKELLLGA